MNQWHALVELVVCTNACAYLRVHDISISAFSLIMVLLVLSEVLRKHIKQTQLLPPLQFAS